MSLPGFSAEVAIYRRTFTYQAGWGPAQTTRLGAETGRIVPMIPGGGGGGGGFCNPGCETCESDGSSPTGCSQSCIAKNCNEYTRSCRGCSNPCEGGQMCGNVCTDPNTDRNNCGGCGNVCSPGVSCHNGTCGCAPGQVICNGVCTNTNVNPSNCGSCGNVCSAGHICQNGTCVEANCQVFCSEWDNCNQTCGAWPPGLSNYQCWFDCLRPSIDCLTSTCH